MLSSFLPIRRRQESLVRDSYVGKRNALLDSNDIRLSDHQLGAGRFGSVCAAEWHGTDVAIKRCVPNLEVDGRTKQLLVEEIEKILPHAHPHILPLYGVCELPTGGLWLVLKHGKKGSLSDVLREGGWRGHGKGCPRKLAVHICKCICSALAYLHSQNPPIVYRDLKPGNIIMSGAMSPLLDPEFGALRTILSEIVAIRTRTNLSKGTGMRVSDAAYHAPESLSAVTHDDWKPPSDMYSLGLLLYDMSTGLPPYANQTEADVVKHLLAKERPALPGHLHPRISSIIQSCWDENPASRPTARVLLQVFSDLEREFAEDADKGLSEYVGGRGSRFVPSPVLTGRPSGGAAAVSSPLDLSLLGAADGGPARSQARVLSAITFRDNIDTGLNASLTGLNVSLEDK